MKNEYPDSKSDLFAAFIERVAAMVNRHGLMAQVTMQSWMFLSSYEKLRVKLQSDSSIVAMLHMGNMVMRIAFGTAATVWEVGGPRSRAGSYTYFEIADLDGDVPRTFPAHNERTAKADHGGYFEVSQADFAAIPGSPIVYWLSEKMRGSFATGRPLSEVANLRQGLATADNGRFLREWWEVSAKRTAFACTSRDEAAASGARWFPYNKGGEFRKWYGNQEHVVNWENDGAEIRTFGSEDGGRPRSRAQNTDTYFSPSVSWSDIGAGDAHFRRFPAGFIHDVKGMSGFGDEPVLDLVVMLMNSSVARGLLKAIAPTVNFQVGDVGKIRVPSEFNNLPALTNPLVVTSQEDWDSSETSWNFTGNPLVAFCDNG